MSRGVFRFGENPGTEAAAASRGAGGELHPEVQGAYFLQVAVVCVGLEGCYTGLLRIIVIRQGS